MYDRLRPGYPSAALDGLLPLGARRVVDVGAGTGKLTAALTDRGLDVVAVEPDDAMRAVLTNRVPAADVRAGTAEALPLGDEEVDVVFFAQAWHWAQPERAAREAARVLVPGGTLAMLWNVQDDRVPWVAALNRIAGSEAGIAGFEDPPPLAGFGPAERADVAWSLHLSPTDLVDLVRTWSPVSTLPAASRAKVLTDIRELVATSPGALPQICTTRAYRRSPA